MRSLIAGVGFVVLATLLGCRSSQVAPARDLPRVVEVSSEEIFAAAFISSLGRAHAPHLARNMVLDAEDRALSRQQQQLRLEMRDGRTLLGQHGHEEIVLALPIPAATVDAGWPSVEAVRLAVLAARNKRLMTVVKNTRLVVVNREERITTRVTTHLRLANRTPLPAELRFNETVANGKRSLSIEIHSLGDLPVSYWGAALQDFIRQAAAQGSAQTRRTYSLLRTIRARPNLSKP